VGVLSSAFIAVIGVVLGCGELPKPIVLRLPPTGSPLGAVTQLTVDGATRSGVIVVARSGIGHAEFVAGPLDRGTIRVEVGMPSGVDFAESVFHISLRANDWRSKVFGLDVPACQIRWEAWTGSSGWRHCDLEVPRRLDSAVVEARIETSGDGEYYVAEPLYTPYDRSEQPDVYVLLLDTVRADKLRPFTTTLPIGKHLEDLARDAIVFGQLRSSSSWTRTALATLFTGLRADRHKVYGRLDVLHDDVPSLPALLQQNGYVTAAWSANPNVLPMWGLARGFDVFHDVGSQDWAGEKTDAERLFATVRDKIEVAPRAPGLFYVHLMDAHAPYVPPAADRRAVDAIPGLVQTFPRPLAVFEDPDAWDRYRNYLGELIDLDRAIGRFLLWLEETGRYDKSLILIVSDHGEEFLDHGGRDHGRTLYEEMLRVPALLKLPDNRGAGTMIANAVAFEDMLPTLLAGIGVPAPPQLDGCNALEPDCRDRPHFAELRLDGHARASLIVEPWKLIVDQTSRRRELYDLMADPFERQDLSLANEARVAEMEQLLASALSRSAHGWHIRLCGGDDTVEIAFSLRGVQGAVKDDSLEEEDVVATTQAHDRDLVVRFVLRPYDATREFFGRFVTQRVRDEDELRIEPDAAVGPMRLDSNSELRVVIGASKIVTSARSLDLTALRADAVVPGTTVIACPPAPPAPAAPDDAALAKNVPLIRLWYVEPPTALRAEHVDPAVADRLRALGYVW